MSQELVKAKEKIVELQLQNESLKKDAERLAWLINNGVQVTSVGGEPIRLTREVIDAAMQGEQP